MITSLKVNKKKRWWSSISNRFNVEGWNWEKKLNLWDRDNFIERKLKKIIKFNS